ncbi:hypothetical protein ACU4GD_13990 [Cupriavidus basilensis]
MRLLLQSPQPRTWLSEGMQALVRASLTAGLSFQFGYQTTMRLGARMTCHKDGSTITRSAGPESANLLRTARSSLAGQLRYLHHGGSARRSSWTRISRLYPEKRGSFPFTRISWLNQAAPLAAINHALEEALDDLTVPTTRAGKIGKTPVKRIGMLSASVELGEEPTRRKLPDDPALRV